MHAMHFGPTSVSPRHRRTAWLAMLLMALNALWPLLAAAQPADSVMMEVCTAQGRQLIAGERSPSQNGSGAKDPVSHCTLCAGSDKPVLADVAPDSIPVTILDSSPGEAWPPIAPQGYRRSPAHPRAPPVLS
jgi:hypothetical protein